MEGSDSLRHQAVRSLITVSRQHRTMADNALRALQFHTTQHHLLMYLTCHPGATQKEIAGHFDVSPANIAALLKKMESAEVIRRVPSLSDTRCRQVVVTEKGKQIVETTRGLFERLDEGVFDGFTDEEITAFCGLLTRIGDNIRKMEQEDEGKQ